VLILISSAPDTREFQTALSIARLMEADICLLQSAVYAARHIKAPDVYVLDDDLMLRGIRKDEVSGKIVDYGQLIDLMDNADKVAGCF
jgi:sulfur relay protein TusB/DsrH